MLRIILQLFVACISGISCLSLFNASVTVLDSFCLDFYYEGTGDGDSTQSQLELRLDIAYGSTTSAPYYFFTGFEDFAGGYHFTFVKKDNILLDSIMPRALELDATIDLPAISPEDNVTITLFINPVIKWKNDGTVEGKCSPDDRNHSLVVDPRNLLQNSTSDTYHEQITIDLSKTPCLTTAQDWFKGSKPQITVEIHINCHGPCEDQFTTTSTSTTSPATTGITKPYTNSTSLPTPGHNQTQNGDADSNKLVAVIVPVAVIAVLEFILVVGCAVYILRKLKPTCFILKRKEVNTSTVYYDTGIQQANIEGPIAPLETSEYYAEKDDKNVACKPEINSFADNALYGP